MSFLYILKLIFVLDNDPVSYTIDFYNKLLKHNMDKNMIQMHINEIDQRINLLHWYHRFDIIFLKRFFINIAVAMVVLLPLLIYSLELYFIILIGYIVFVLFSNLLLSIKQYISFKKFLLKCKKIIINRE